MPTGTRKNHLNLTDEPISELDESIVEKLTSRNNKKQRLTENTQKVYQTVIRGFNLFLKNHGLTVNQESVQPILIPSGIPLRRQLSIIRNMPC